MRWVWDKERQELVEVHGSGAPGPQRGPFIWKDHEGYISPATGRYVEGRAARREDMARSGCIDANDFGNVSGGILVESPGQPGYDPGAAADYQRDRNQRYGARVIQDAPR